MGPKGSVPGDLYVALRVAEHQLFRREGNDIVFALRLGLAEAALGLDLDVPTLDGTTKLKFPAGTQTGKEFRLRDRGVPVLHGSGRGDERVLVQVETPQNLTHRQKELLTEFMKLEHEKGDKGFFGRMKDALGG